MKTIDPQIADICRRLRITDYLRSRNVPLQERGGNRWLCSCPLGTHRDSDPSFNVNMLADGTELFKCWGCKVGGNIITLMSAMEKERKITIIKKISSQLGIKLQKIDMIKIELLPDEVDEIFCAEQDVASDIVQYALSFMQAHPTEDVINKISRMYDMLDRMVRQGNISGIKKYHDLLVETIAAYETHPKKETNES